MNLYEGSRLRCGTAWCAGELISYISSLDLKNPTYETVYNTFWTF
jgi:hypothetical protein